MSLSLRHDVPLADRTTLHIGGRAQVWAPVHTADDARAALAHAAARDLPVWVLGGGSNAIVADAGLPGLVLHPAASSWQIVREDADQVVVRADAGACWDSLVRWAVERELGGLTCLSGIPGHVGAAPIQNIGAYGQELAQVFVEAEVLDLRSGEARVWSKSDCAFSYRDSALKRASGRYLVLSVSLALTPKAAPTLRYGELARRFAQDASPPTLRAVRDTVLALRRGKGMVVDTDDPDSRSAGSFFMNPVVHASAADDALARLRARRSDRDAPLVMPRYPVPGRPDHVKLSAAWLIDQSGLSKGYTAPGFGDVGLSRKHTLALVNRGAATARDLLAFADHVRDQVAAASGVTLHREPVVLSADTGLRAGAPTPATAAQPATAAPSPGGVATGGPDLP